VFISARRDAKAAHRFFERAISATKVIPVEVTTDRAPAYPAVLEELLPAAWHRADRYANNRVECDHGRLKARLRAMRGLKEDRSAKVIIAGFGFIQNIRRGHYELAVDEPAGRRVAVAFDELAWRSDLNQGRELQHAPAHRTQQCRQKATLLWDGLPAHRSHAMHAWLRRQRSWLVVEPLPAYALELNLVEPLWSSLKGVELANLAGDTLDDVIAAAECGIQRIRHTHHLAFSLSSAWSRWACSAPAWPTSSTTA
jgi:DDE domain/DDE superfamily endonuclease